MSDPNPLLSTPRMLGEARRILEGVEATALGGVAQMLAETAESLARTVRELEGRKEKGFEASRPCLL